MLKFIGKFEQLKDYGFETLYEKDIYIRYHNKSNTIFTVLRFLSNRRKKGMYDVELFSKKDLLPKVNMQKYVNNMNLKRPNKWKYYSEEETLKYNEDLIKDGLVIKEDN